MSRAPDGKTHGAEVRGQVKAPAYYGERSDIYVNIEVLKHRSPSAR